MKRLIPFAAILTCLPASAAAQATPYFSAADHADAECALLLFAVSQSPEMTESEGQLNGTMAIYFIGKLIGRGVDYEAVMLEDLDRFDRVDMAALGERCSEELIALGEDMQRFGAQVQELEHSRR
ncbi:MAG: hypothetical protein LC634_01190 [Sphingomonadales bacterium]|nr:hypothetical protein [Sphingomonadales bacterium]